MSGLNRLTRGTTQLTTRLTNESWDEILNELLDELDQNQHILDQIRNISYPLKKKCNA